MLREYKTSEELRVLKDETSKFPEFLNVHFDIVRALTNDFPVFNRQFFVYKNEGDLVVISYRIFKAFPFRPALFVCYDTETGLDEKLLWQLYDELYALAPEIFVDQGSTRPLLQVIYGIAANVYQKWYQTTFPTQILVSNPCYMFYMTKSQQNTLLADFKNGIPLPEGYSFDKVDLENDLTTIVSTWKHARAHDHPVIRSMVEFRPYSLIRHDDTGKPVAFELTDSRGALNHQFTQPEHRGKGLGSAVEKDISIKLIRENSTPFKYVEGANENVVSASLRSKYWTRWEEGKGTPLMTHYLYDPTTDLS